LHGATGPQFVQIVTDQLDQLYAVSVGSGPVMTLALHPFAMCWASSSLPTAPRPSRGAGTWGLIP
jgi:hypothetical protein